MKQLIIGLFVVALLLWLQGCGEKHTLKFSQPTVLENHTPLPRQTIDHYELLRLNFEIERIDTIDPNYMSPEIWHTVRGRGCFYLVTVMRDGRRSRSSEAVCPVGGKSSLALPGREIDWIEAVHRAL